jgi:hypothetical protein
VSTVVLPASEALILPCMAMVAAAAVVLALLTSPPKDTGSQHAKAAKRFCKECSADLDGNEQRSKP